MLSCAPTKANTPAYLAAFFFPCKSPHFGANFVKNPFFSQNTFPKRHFFSSIGAGQKMLKLVLLCHFLWFSRKSLLPFLTHNRLFFLHFLRENHCFLSKIPKNVGFSSSPFRESKARKTACYRALLQKQPPPVIFGCSSNKVTLWLPFSSPAKAPIWAQIL